MPVEISSVWMCPELSTEVHRCQRCSEVFGNLWQQLLTYLVSEVSGCVQSYEQGSIDVRGVQKSLETFSKGC